jgi:hypothetical protein
MAFGITLKSLIILFLVRNLGVRSKGISSFDTQCIISAQLNTETLVRAVGLVYIVRLNFSSSYKQKRVPNFFRTLLKITK